MTDRRLLPARRGNRVRILGLVRGLRSSGWQVELICLPDAGSDDDLRRVADAVHRVRARPFDGGEVSRFDSRPFRWAVERVVAARRPGVVIAEYAWLGPALGHLPRSVRRVVDCHDVLHERTDRFTAAGLDPWVRCTRSQEADLLRSRGPAPHRTGARPGPPAWHAAEHGGGVRVSRDRRSGAAPGGRGGSTALAVGASHAGNDGITRFAAAGWPAVVAAVPDARLEVVGSVPAGAPGPGVRFLGEVDDLRARYRSAAVVVCPIEVGTGVKIKMIEALRYGKAVVATPAAVEGLPLPDEPAWVEAADLDECASAVAALLSSPDERARVERGAAAFAERHLSPEVIRSGLDGVLRGGRPARWPRPMVIR